LEALRLGTNTSKFWFDFGKMVKSYDRWGPTQAFGIVCSAGANSVYDGKLAYVPALEDVLVWDVKKGQMVSVSR
jgi:U3 small nucleolar RNA-associated protein 12